MDFSKIPTITIAHVDFLDIIAGKTRNPLGEMEVLRIIKAAIEAGTKVVLTDPVGVRTCRLTLAKDGKFQYSPLGQA